MNNTKFDITFKVLVIVSSLTLLAPAHARDDASSTTDYQNSFDAGLLSLSEGRWLEAKKQFLSAKAFAANRNPESQEYADAIRKIAETDLSVGQISEAEMNLTECIALEEKLKAPESTICGAALSLAQVYEQQYKYEQAEPLYKRALKNTIRESSTSLRPANSTPDATTIACALATVYLVQGKFAEAEPLFKSVVDDLDKKLKSAKNPEFIQQENTILSNSLHNLSVCMIKNGHPKDAVPLEARSKKLMGF